MWKCVLLVILYIFGKFVRKVQADEFTKRIVQKSRGSEAAFPPVTICLKIDSLQKLCFYIQKLNIQPLQLKWKIKPKRAQAQESEEIVK